MPSVIQLPAGLTGLLGLRSGGEYPSELNYVVQPTVDLTELYANNQLEHGFALFTPALGFVLQDGFTLPGEISLTVPPGEFWFVQHVTLRLNPAAGISYRGQIVLREDPSQFTALSDITAAVVANPMHVLVKGQSGFWMTPRTTLAANYDTITGVPGAGTSLMTVRFARFRQ